MNMFTDPEFKRAKALLEKKRFFLDSLGIQNTELETEKQRSTYEVLIQVIQNGLAETKDTQKIWDAHDLADQLIVQFLDPIQLSGVCERFIVRLISKRLIDENKETQDRLVTTLTELKKKTEELSKITRDSDEYKNQLYLLRDQVGACIGNIYELSSLKVGRKKFQKDIIYRITFLGILILFLFIIVSNFVFEPGISNGPTLFSTLGRIIFGCGFCFAIAGMAGGVVAQATRAAQQKPFISSLMNSLSIHLLYIVLGGILGIALIFFTRSEILFGNFIANLGEQKPFAEMALAFLAGLIPSTISRLMQNLAGTPPAQKPD